jgi:hypothetical protein
MSAGSNPIFFQPIRWSCMHKCILLLVFRFLCLPPSSSDLDEKRKKNVHFQFPIARSGQWNTVLCFQHPSGSAAVYILIVKVCFLVQKKSARTTTTKIGLVHIVCFKQKRFVFCHLSSVVESMRQSFGQKRFGQKCFRQKRLGQNVWDKNISDKNVSDNNISDIFLLCRYVHISG